MGAFRKGSDIIPVKLEIKQKATVQNNLYVVVSMTKIPDAAIKNEIDVTGSAHTSDNSLSDPLPGIDPVYSIPQIVSKINPKDGRFLRNLPDQILTFTIIIT